MEPLLIFGAFAAVAYFLSFLGDEVWEQVAADLGLGFSRTVIGVKSLHGNLRGFDVAVTEDPQDERSGLRAEVHGVDPDFTLGPDSSVLRMVKPDIETGDALFDERIRVEGDADRALAVLGDEARRLIEIVVSGSKGEMKHRVLWVPLGRIQDAGPALDSMLDLAQLLRRPTARELPDLLAQRALHDPSRGVRLQAFRQLTTFPRSPQIYSTAEQLLEAPSGALRLKACLVLLRAEAERSSDAAETLIRLATLHHVDSAIRRSALEALAASRHRDAAIPAMVEILRPSGSAPPVVRRAALEGLVEAGAREALLEIHPAGAEEAEVLARGLGGLDVAAQSRLMELLEHSGDRVRLAAIGSLGRVGDVGCIAALRRVAGQDKLFKSAVARAAKQAIGEIKARAGGSQRGEISLARVEPLDGAVSQADDSEAGGEVSLTP